jgi:hypothetical protein
MFLCKFDSFINNSAKIPSNKGGNVITKVPNYVVITNLHIQ